MDEPLETAGRHGSLVQMMEFISSSRWSLSPWAGRKDKMSTDAEGKSVQVKGVGMMAGALLAHSTSFFPSVEKWTVAFMSDCSQNLYVKRRAKGKQNINICLAGGQNQDEPALLLIITPFSFSLIKLFLLKSLWTHRKLQSTESSPITLYPASPDKDITKLQYQNQETDIGTVLLTGPLASLLPLPSKK